MSEKTVNIERLFEDIKKNKKAFSLLKSAAIMAQSFEQAAHIRDMDKQLFPKTSEENEAKKLAEDALLLFKMVGFDLQEQSAWLLYQSVIEHQKLQGQFSIKDACALTDKAINIFQ